MNQRYLPTYLNDHLAGAVGATDLAGRAASSNADNEYGQFLEELRDEIAEDKATLEMLMERLEVKKDPLKTTAAHIAERLGRLKPNAHLTGYSPLSRVIELEALSLGVAGKLALWHSLRSLAHADDRLDVRELEALIDRGERQRDAIESHRLRAIQQTLA